MNYHIGRLVLSSLCVGDFGAGGFWWCSFCRLKPAKRTPPKIILMSETCWAHNKWNKIASVIKLVFHSSTICPEDLKRGGGSVCFFNEVSAIRKLCLTNINSDSYYKTHLLNLLWSLVWSVCRTIIKCQYWLPHTFSLF